MADGSAVWIAKPSVTNQAIGICVFDRVSSLRAALAAAEGMREWVLQRCAHWELLLKADMYCHLPACWAHPFFACMRASSWS